MNLLMLGPQGSGKGTQAELLENKFGLQHMDMGQLLRAATENKHFKRAQEIREYQNKGDLVPDDIVLEVAEHYIDMADKTKGILYDGFPRKIEQYKKLKEIFKKNNRRIDAVIYLHIDEEETVRRLTARRSCPKCGNIYNLITNPPLKEGWCNTCGSKLEQRDDDKPEVVKERLKVYRENTFPVVEQAKKDGFLVEINGNQPIEKIHEEIVVKLDYA